jgi:hypothetical protein
MAAITSLWSISIYLTVLGLIITLSFGVESFITRRRKRRARVRAVGRYSAEAEFGADLLFFLHTLPKSALLGLP